MLSNREAQRLLPQSQKYGITILQKEVVDKSMIDIIKRQYISETAWLLSGCLTENSCVFNEKDKPLACAIYPFTAFHIIGKPLDIARCSQTKAIANNPDTFARILETRAMCGYRDNDRYKEMIEFILNTEPINLG